MTLVKQTLENGITYTAIREHNKIVTYRKNGKTTAYVLYLNLKTNNKLRIYRITVDGINIDVEHKDIFKPRSGISAKEIRRKTRYEDAKTIYDILEKLYEEAGK